MSGKLYLIPALLGEGGEEVLSPYILDRINKIKFFIVENERTSRRYLIKLGIETAIDDLTFFILNKHTNSEELSGFIDPILNGNDVGLLSEAGVPGVADPGASVVSIAHNKDISVVPMVGPSSILLAVMASGLNGQNFAFNGYLPIKNPDRKNKIKHFERRSVQENQTQCFIETPYRNNSLLEDFVRGCHPNTKLCIACNVTLPDEFIITKSMADWKKNLPDLNKKPTVFLIHSS